ncbi:hypothetical protein PSA01_53580 [Pseudonocardia saturnea]|uniref:Uncharacterized protein n=1 Tax=Pseudonocardia saturnea TaxID=33909 RepID=A0ABQ0S6U1_9PSEU|nr:hypothetical protein Pdca_62040 [Pseudonocardia autotrophica]GEC28329.1 hypothetical protein PSA01_53580 [Pseudonocardia saturnea]
MRIRDCPAAVSGNDRRHQHWEPTREATASRHEHDAHESEYLPPVRAPTGVRGSVASREGRTDDRVRTVPAGATVGTGVDASGTCRRALLRR